MAGHNLNPDQGDCLDLLCRLVQDCEAEQGAVAVPRVTGLDALRPLLAEHGMGGADLSRLLDAPVHPHGRLARRELS